MELAPLLAAQDDVIRKAKIIHGSLTLYQKCISSLELCSKPVLAAIHSGCVGAGVNLVTAADVRYCTADAWFQLKEVSAIIMWYFFYRVPPLTLLTIGISETIN